VQPVTAALVTAARRVHRSQRDVARLPTMHSRGRQDTVAVSEGHREGDPMFDDAATVIRVLAGCVLGGCFAVAVIVSVAVG
jgi:hypothetical protein